MVEARADLVTSDNLGVLPPAVVAGLVEPMSLGRPLLASTLRLEAPIAGVGMTLPLVVIRPTAGVQVGEKEPLAHTTGKPMTGWVSPRGPRAGCAS